jgi:hypothetical protein
MHGALPPPYYVFMAWCLVKHRDNFTFTLSLVVNVWDNIREPGFPHTKMKYNFPGKFYFETNVILMANLLNKKEKFIS